MAVERYLDVLRLGEGSRRIYRIALATWAWTLVGLSPPTGRARRGSAPPVVPLAMLDDPAASARLRAAVADRSAALDRRTVGRELSILRGAIAWWSRCGWIAQNPLDGLRAPSIPPTSVAGLTSEQVAAVLKLPAELREQTLWHFVYESGAPIQRLLALDVADLDRSRRRARSDPSIRWRAGTARLLSFLLVGRTAGPLFLASRSAPPGSRDRCPLTGRGRLSYRRAAELFTAATRSLDPSGRGFTLRQLRVAARRPRPLRDFTHLLVRTESDISG